MSAAVAWEEDDDDEASSSTRLADDDDENEEDFGPSPRVSFFTAHTDGTHDVRDVLRADVLVCDRVWNMFAKDSNARGFDCRSPQSKAASKAKRGWKAAPRALPKREEKPMMNGTTTNGALSNELKLTLSAYAAMKKELGRVPMATELAPKLGVGVSAVRYRIGELAKRGLAETAPRGGIPKGPASTRAKPRRAKQISASAPAPKPPRETSSDPVIAALIARRDDFRRKADALDVAIEAMAVAL